jgi:hypothetical protein
MFPPQRIVCLTEETVETLYLLGEQDRIVGISGYCVRPPEARRDKPRVSAFTSADIPKILDLRTDLVLSFSDLQADIVAALIRMLGALVGAADKAGHLADELDAWVADSRRRAMPLPRRPLVYFEEWDQPMISGIAWVSELPPAAPTSLLIERPESRRKNASLRQRRSSPASPTSSSVRGAARNFGPRRSPPDPVSQRYRPSETTRCTKSSRRSSCSRGPPPRPTDCNHFRPSSSELDKRSRQHRLKR